MSQAWRVASGAVRTKIVAAGTGVGHGIEFVSRRNREVLPAYDVGELAEYFSRANEWGC